MRGSRRGGGGGAGPEGEAEGRGMRSPRRPAEKARAAVSSGEERGGLGSPRQALLSRVPPSRLPLRGLSTEGSPQPGILGQVSSAGSPQWAQAASGDRAEGRRRRRRRRESLARGSRSWTRLRRPRRPEARRERAHGRPSPLATACGQRRGGDSEAGPVTGAGPGEAGDAPRPRLRLLPGPTAPSALGPPPPPPQATRPTAPFPAPSASRARPAAPQVTSGRPGPGPGCGSRKNAWPAEGGGGGAALRAPGPGRCGDSLPRVRRLRAPRPAGRVGGRKRRRP